MAESKPLLHDDPEQGQRWRVPAQPSLVLPVLYATLYGVVAVSMNFMNKAVLLEFQLSNVLLLDQMLLVLLLMPVVKAGGFVTFPALTVQKSMSLLPVSILYVANVAFSLVGLQTLNIPMYNTLKRLTPMLILMIKALMTRRLPPRDIFASVAMVVGGCIVAGIGDFSFDLKGYSFALASCGLQAAYLLLVESSGVDKGVSTTELMMYNAIAAIPMILLVVLVTGEAWKVAPAVSASVSHIGPLPFGAMLLGAGMLGMLLNFSQFLCTMHNSALTTTIVGVLKGVAATALGFFAFGGVQFSLVNVLGIVLNTTGGCWYTLIKYQQRQQPGKGKAVK